MKKRTILIIALLGVVGVATALSHIGSQGRQDIPANVLTVFQKHCVRCHTGSKPPRGLSLIPGKIAAAIDAPSAEFPALKIIDSQTPEASYLLKKIRRQSDITGRPMPPGKALTSEEVGTLVSWIAGLK
jgi:mono/diheme cytochrome c family protein